MAENRKPKETLVDSTYQKIKSDIAERRLCPGERINLKELSTRYQVSETPLKQALVRLVSEDLVEDTPRKGMKIKELSYEDLDELFDMRLMMELFYLDKILFTCRCSPDLLDELADNVARNRALVAETTGDLDAFVKNYEFDYAFHILFLRFSGCRRLLQLYQKLNTHSYSNYLYRRQSRERTLAGIREHQEIVDALASGDAERLRTAVTVHIENARSVAKMAIKLGSL